MRRPAPAGLARLARRPPAPPALAQSLAGSSADAADYNQQHGRLRAPSVCHVLGGDGADASNPAYTDDKKNNQAVGGLNPRHLRHLRIGHAGGADASNPAYTDDKKKQPGGWGGKSAASAASADRHAVPSRNSRKLDQEREYPRFGQGLSRSHDSRDPDDLLAQDYHRPARPLAPGNPRVLHATHYQPPSGTA